MANNTDSERLWMLTDAAVIKAAGTPVVVRKLIFFPAAVNDDVVIHEYAPDGTARIAIRMKAGPSVALPVDIDFGNEGRSLNGFRLLTIDAGYLDVYLGSK